MKAFSYIFTGDGMFYNIYKMKLVDQVVYEVYCKIIWRQPDAILILDPTPRNEDAVSISFNFKHENFLTDYFQNYMWKKWFADGKTRVQIESNYSKQMLINTWKKLLGRFKNLQCFTGKSMDLDTKLMIWWRFEKNVSLMVY